MRFIFSSGTSSYLFQETLAMCVNQLLSSCQFIEHLKQSCTRRKDLPTPANKIQDDRPPNVATITEGSDSV